MPEGYSTTRKKVNMLDPRRLVSQFEYGNKGEWFHYNEELHGSYSSPSIVMVIKARRMRWAGNVARMGEVRGACNILVGGP
jgi:hypothetical protein